MGRLIRSEKERLEVRNFVDKTYARCEDQELCSSSRALRMFIEQSHDEVYGFLKGGSGNSGGKTLAISMVEEAWLSVKREM
ncbi:hypothetical protein Tco_0780506 [Tanacetum coccineum]